MGVPAAVRRAFGTIEATATDAIEELAEINDVQLAARLIWDLDQIRSMVAADHALVACFGTAPDEATRGRHSQVELLGGLFDVYRSASQLASIRSSQVQVSLSFPGSAQADSARAALETALDTLCLYVTRFRDEFVDGAGDEDE